MWGKPRVIPVTVGENPKDVPPTKDGAASGGAEKGEQEEGQNHQTQTYQSEGEGQPAKKSWRLRRRRKLADEDTEAEEGTQRPHEAHDFCGASIDEDQGIVEGSQDAGSTMDGQDGGGADEASGQADVKRKWRFGRLRMMKRKVLAGGETEGEWDANEVVKEVTEVHVARGEDGDGADGRGKGVLGRFRRRRERRVSVSNDESNEDRGVDKVVVGAEAEDGAGVEHEREDEGGSFTSSVMSKNATMPERLDSHSNEVELAGVEEGETQNDAEGELPVKKKGIMSAMRKSVRRKLGIKLKKEREAERLMKEGEEWTAKAAQFGGSCPVASTPCCEVSG
mmetsp:Transcript_16868/g.38972  ORF Transcript_16868/g.38972 Transcript_16868/m.38972 type:complete len:337 (-) Transcript_16868:209-1219(-)